MSAESGETAERTVFVVDDDAGVLDAVCLLLRSAGLPTRPFPSATAFLEVYDPRAPGCIVLDLRMPDMSGMELQERLLEMDSTTPIIFITAHGEVPTAVRAVKAGAVDFIQKPFQDAKLLDRVTEALEMDARVREERTERQAARDRLETLTPREREVMSLVVAGRANKRISRELAISQRTVEIHRARVMRKMRVGSVSELVRVVMAAGEPGG